MLDPIPARNPPWLRALITPFADLTNLPTLKHHIHEVVFAAALYQFVLIIVSPVVSSFLFRQRYNNLSTRTRFNWDVHVVSLVQSILVCVVALYVNVYDQERSVMGWKERVYGYTGGLGAVQAMACGYFVWDLYICIRYIDLFGPGMLAHAIAALNVYSFGFVSSLL
jgi:TLC domain